MKIERLFVDRAVASSEETENVTANLDVPPETVSNDGEVFNWVHAADDPVLRGKKTLYITTNRGAVIRDCPGTSHYRCCNYTILHTGTYCTMDCSYCILQSYFHPPVLRYFADRKTISASLDQVFRQKKIFRIGTGEFTDSLIWETVSDQAPFLVRKFAGQANAILELKTKTVNIDALKGLDHNGKTVVAWSLNTPEVVRSEERGTAGIDARLRAAKQCASWGYRLAFHFDPVIIYEGCREAYRKVIEKLFTYVAPENILWISIGSFRFMPQLKGVIENRFPGSRICYGEFVQGMDKKMRYFKELRVAVYKEMVRCIGRAAPEVLTYFCMEDDAVWERCTGLQIQNEQAIGRMLDRSAVSHCGLDAALL